MDDKLARFLAHFTRAPGEVVDCSPNPFKSARLWTRQELSELIREVISADQAEANDRLLRHVTQLAEQQRSAVCSMPSMAASRV